jgi:hypothetical protein
MAMHDLAEGIILTYHQEEIIRLDTRIIQVLPVWKWLIGYRDDEAGTPESAARHS